MKKYILLFALLFCAQYTFCQDDSAYIVKHWPVIAADTSLTYQQIVTICDSMFAQAGFGADTATGDTIGEGEEYDLDGSPYVMYQRWRFFWAGRCDVATGKPHNFKADVLEALNAQNKTTTASLYATMLYKLAQQ